MGEHTNIPWEFEGNCGGYITESGARIARAYARDDAIFIVQAANSYDQLFDALQGLVDWCNEGCPEGGAYAMIEARAALKSLRVVQQLRQEG